MNEKKSGICRRVIRFGSLASLFAVTVLTALYQPEASAESAVEAQTDSITTAQSEASAESAVEAQTDNITTAQSEASTESALEAQTGSITGITVPGSHEELYHTLYDQFFSYSEEEFYPGLGARLYSARGMTVDEAAAEEIIVTDEAPVLYSAESSDMAASDTASANSSVPASGDFSTTNVQEQGVDEADIIKTDGEYIYILREDLSIVIVKAQGNASQIVSVTKLPIQNSGAIQEMYLDGDALHVILTETSSELIEDGDTYYTQTSRRTALLTYDISDRSTPALSGQITQDGSYADSRKNGDYIYLFTRYTPDICDTFEDSTVAPAINGAAVQASDFYLPENLTDISYLVISSVHTAAPGEVFESKILVSGASQFYVSQNNIYIANEFYGMDTTTTNLTRFHYEDGHITGAAAGSVKGYLNNSFSMNEYNGCLRVVSTYNDENWNELNALYILDESLTQIGAIENLAKDETIRSARFFGDTGYFVTFRQTDPLFSVDLSAPENPRILGELKISGFSSYLHFYGEDTLLGIGYEADESTGGITGLKLSMFDISDPSDVQETTRLVIPGITWCPAIEDYKSILVDPEKNLIGFYCDNRYMVYSYDVENGFVRELSYDFYADNLTGEADYYNMRGLYIGEDLYLAGNSFVITFDMADEFRQTGLLTMES